MATRNVKSTNDFFDILNNLKNNTFVSIGYVTGANVDMPKIKKKNPETGRLKGYPDYTPFKKEGYDQEIGALVRITSYNFRYYKKEEFNKQYDAYKTGANAIRVKHGIDPIQDKESNYSGSNSWVKDYRGDNEEKIGNTYTDQNIFDAKKRGINYVVDINGNIIRALDDAEVKPYLKKKRDIDGVAALRKIYGEDAELQQRIEDYTNEINNLKFRYMRFESKSILWMCATVKGEKIVYINDSLQRAVDDININPSDFRQIARERYQISLNDLHESIVRFNKLINENKKIVRLTESELKQAIAEAVTRMLMQEQEEINEEMILKTLVDRTRELGFDAGSYAIGWKTIVATDYDPGDYWTPPSTTDKEIDVDIPMEDVLDYLVNDDEFLNAWSEYEDTVESPDENYFAYQWIKTSLSRECLERILESIVDNYVDEDEYLYPEEPDRYDEWRDSQL